MTGAALRTACIATVLTTCMATAQTSDASLDLTVFQYSFANMLASEAHCNLSYNQPAIERLIAEKVPKDDMNFAFGLTGITAATKLSLKNQTESERTAHCTAVTNSARHLGLID